MWMKNYMNPLGWNKEMIVRQYFTSEKAVYKKMTRGKQSCREIKLKENFNQPLSQVMLVPENLLEVRTQDFGNMGETEVSNESTRGISILLRGGGVST